MKILYLSIRSLTRFRLYTFINVVGLAMSLACVITLCRYIYREVTTDHFVNDLDRVCFTTTDNATDKIQKISAYSGSALPDLKSDPAIEASSYFLEPDQQPLSYNEKKYDANVLVADNNFLNIITYPVLQTVHQPLLSKPDEAVITEKYAKKIFGDKNPLGETLFYYGKNIKTTGILAEPQSGTK